MNHMDAYRQDMAERPIPPFTAWITTDATCLSGDFADVVVLANDHNGSSTGDSLFSAETTMRHDADDNDGLFEEARVLLVNAGWSLDGEWRGVQTGYIVNVTRFSEA